ncbi:MAG: hypothetical protein ACJ741_10815, partial [Pyrinomonadaceae bacterium]
IITILTRNGSGNLSREEVFDAKRRLKGADTYSYEYDSRGNWVKQTKSTAFFNNGKYSESVVKGVYYRIITYY